MSPLIADPQELVVSSNATLRQSKSNEFNWVFFAVIASFHLGGLASFFCFHWSSLVIFLAIWILSQNVGIAVSYHRQLTHRGFTTPKWLEHVMALCGAMALQGSPTYWVAVHRMHHQYTDKPGDPHSPRDGKWWSHMGWILTGKSMHHDTTTLARYVPDLAKDKFHVWITKYHYVPIIALGATLLALGGLPFLMWGIFVRTTVGLHATWLVNSATHTWGSRRFRTKDLSTNNWWVAILTFGEGWHNNHHAHPVSARHGLKWYEVDMNWYGIWALKKLGLARHVYRVKLSELRRRGEEGLPTATPSELVSA